ncbi:ABC transporter substrate-binding protein [Galliscardovia ingluviei]|uniref:ABC transporter substrate-binding protein n=1 Tax=Galliscardovia ingluviei TaxID=1769422 RepID=A0A8J3AL94_9BIFI|nr:ABC transporter substrate-binding protein [Galliscardovia ingluviei]GGI12776.1 ABC transporter substrate-binding protein [Galliscardovia ingluviei]
MNTPIRTTQGRTLKTIVAVLSALALTTSLAACSSDSTDSSKGHVYFMNNKPEVVDQYKQLADMYTKETGVKVDIQTGASGTYDATMTSELAKSNAPTMFNVSGFDQFAKYQKYVEPLQDTELFKLLNDEGKANSYTIDGKSYTLPYAAEWYGIIYNKKILNTYCSKDYAVIHSADELTNFQTLSKVAKSMQEHKDDLGIEGAFATPGLDASDTYRFTAHMSRIPLYFEYKDMNTTFSKTIKGTYLQNYKDLFDLELHNSPTEPSMVSSKSYDDVTAEFALGKVAFYPNGVWSYSQIKGNEVADEDLGMLPYYMGITGEEETGPAGVYDASWAVNKNASKQDKQATLDFIKWMVTNNDAKKILSQDMGFSVPFTTFNDKAYQPKNPLTTAARAYIEAGKTSVRSFTLPDQQWQDDFSAALIEYAQGTGSWDTFTKAFVNGWSTEWNNNEQVLGSVPQATAFDKQ